MQTRQASPSLVSRGYPPLAAFLTPLLLTLWLLSGCVPTLQAHDLLISNGAAWKFDDTGSFPGAAWIQPNFDDTAWKTGIAQLGYGDGDEKTLVSFGPDDAHKYITTYFRKSFVLSNSFAISNLVLNLVRDDGAVVYLNGIEVFRNNLPAGDITPETLALADLSGLEESESLQGQILPSLLLEGTNIVAVEIHQYSPANADLSFSLQLTANPIYISIEDVFAYEPAPGSNSINSFFLVSISAPPPQAIAVPYTITLGTASPGDFSRPSGTLFIPVLAASRTIGFGVFSDLLVESNETFMIHLSQPTNAFIVRADAVATIVDYADAPKIAVQGTTLMEGSGFPTEIFLPVTLSAAQTQTVSVSFTTGNGTATAGSDFVATNGTLSFLPGQTTNFIKITVLDDAISEADETFVLRLTASANAAILGEGQVATITILNDDWAKPVVSNAAVLEGTVATNTVRFVVSLQPVPSAQTSVQFWTSDGTATAGRDYRPASGTLVFPPQASFQVVDIEIIPNDVFEPEKTFFLNVSNMLANALPVSTGQAAILNDDFPLRIEQSEAREGNSSTNSVTLTLTCLIPLTAEMNLAFATSDLSAKAGLDYVASEGLLRFTPLVTNLVITIPILPDRIAEPTEQFWFRVLDSTRTNMVKTQAVSIHDDDPFILSKGVLALRPVLGTTNFFIPISLSHSSDIPISVNYQSISGSAQAGIDFTSIAGTIQFPAGVTNLSLPITLYPRSEWNPPQSFSIRFSDSLNSPLNATDLVVTLYSDPNPSFAAFGQRLEPPGPCSRLTDLVISEIMYRHSPFFKGVQGAGLDFIELYNSGPFPKDLSGYRLTGDVSYQFPTNFTIQPNSFLVLASSVPAFTAAYGTNLTVLPMFSLLPDNGGTIRLRNRSDAVLLEIKYDDKTPWPTLPDGQGRSLVLLRPSLGESDPRAWDASVEPGGNPGRWSMPSINPLGAVVINEILANSRLPDFDFVELYNRSDKAVDISGCTLSDSPDTNKFVFIGAVIEPGSYLALDDLSLGFKLKAEGDTIYFRNPEGQVLDVVHYGPQLESVSYGRFPEGGQDFFPIFPPTPFAQNRHFYQGDVVINEIMYAPPSANGPGQYIELLNRTDATLDVSGWMFTEGISFTMPAGTSIAPHGFLVVAENASHLLSKYSQLNPQIVKGNFSGSLAANGERVVLSRRDWMVENGVTNALYIEESVVDYSAAAFAAKWSRGQGSSLELLDPSLEPCFGANWLESNESTKGVWTTMEGGGTFTNPISASVELQVMLLGEGECLIDDVQVSQSNGPNLVTNPGFENDLTGWKAAGNHSRSTAQVSAPDAGKALFLRAHGPGNVTDNNVRIQLPSLTVGAPISIKARARWLQGNPRLVLRLNGQAFEASGILPVPEACGTPGQINSRLRRAGPVISQVESLPILPAPAQPLTVSASVYNPGGNPLVKLHYRIDPSPNYTEILMKDDGTDGDPFPLDGIYSARIPGQSSGTLVAFQVEALDPSDESVLSVYPNTQSATELLVRFNEPITNPTTLTEYQVWITASNLTSWKSRSPFSDEPIPCTLAYGTRQLIHNASIRYGGPLEDRLSFTNPLTNSASFLLTFPPGQKLFGSSQLSIEPLIRQKDPTLLREHLLAWMSEQAGLPFRLPRFQQFSINGSRGDPATVPLFLEKGVLDEAFLRAWQDDPSIPLELFEITGQEETIGNGAPVLSGGPNAYLIDDCLCPPRQKAAYRWNWRKVPKDPSDDNYAELLGLADALSAPENIFYNHVSGTIHLDQWLKSLAFVHAVGALDVYGYAAGRNAAAFKPEGGKWQLAFHRLNNPLGAPGGIGPFSDPKYTLQYENTRLMNLREYLPALRGVAEMVLNAQKVLGNLVNPGVQFLQANGLESNSAARSALLDWIIAQRTELDSLRGIGPGLAGSNQLGLQYPASSHFDPLVTVRGTATPDISTISLFIYHSPGFLEPFPGLVTWTSPTNWNIQFYNAANRFFQILGTNVSEGTLSSPAFNLIYTGPPPPLTPTIVFSEIMPASILSRAGFIELYNYGATTVNLAGYLLPELGYTFSPLFLLPPQTRVILPENRTAFTAAYGNKIPLAAELGSFLRSTENILTLYSPTNFVDVDKVKYELGPPWPSTGSNNSLQLRDFQQDRGRLANWSGAYAPAPGLPKLATTQLAQLSPLYINEIQARNSSSPDNAGQLDPWIEIYNSSSSSIVLSDNYFLTDNYSNLKKWAFPAGTVIGPRQFLLVWGDAQPEQTQNGSLHANFRLSTNGSALALVQQTPSGPLVLDYLNYPAIPQGESYGSFPNGQLFYRNLFTISTSGFSNAPPPVFINEWMASNSGQVLDPADDDSDDWFELYNAGAEPVKLDGCFLSDRTGVLVPVPAGTVVPARGHLLIWADSEVSQNSTNRPDLHVPFNLRARGDVITLRARDKSIIDTFAFFNLNNNISQGRWPDGAQNIRMGLLATPGTSNRVSAIAAPVFAAIPNRWIFPGQAVTVPVTATDLDTPQQYLTLKLLPGGPAGAVLQSGFFTWATSLTEPYGTNVVNLQVSDDASPPLSSTTSFQIIVAPPPQLTVTRTTSNQLSISYPTVGPRTYALEYTASLSNPSWVRIQTDTNTLPVQKFLVPLSTNGNRFYRLNIN